MFWQEKNLLFDPDMESEIESIQTDIQRFMAILGFCLMAIFALVQSIPVTVSESETVIENLNRKLDIQKRDLELMKAENQAFREKLMQVEAEKLKVIEIDSRKIQEAGKDLEEQRRTIERLISEKVEREQDIIRFKQLLASRQSEIENLKIEKSRIENLLKDFIAARSEKTAAIPPEPMESPDIPQKPEQPKGLYVAFESDAVFMDLLKKNKISLFKIGRAHV